MTAESGQFFIDVGGTFTDVVARDPAGRLSTYKLLSSGVVRGVVGGTSTDNLIHDGARRVDPPCFWVGYRLSLPTDVETFTTQVVSFDAKRGLLGLDPPLPAAPRPGDVYELYSDEEAPIVAIRYLMGLGLSDSIGPVDVRLGTTRATNALLERKGAAVALVSTSGFEDILRIGNQDRPDLFALDIRKRDDLVTAVIGIDERLSAAGDVEQSPNGDEVRGSLRAARQSGIDALAICLLHAHVNPIHEDLVAAVAQEVGFAQISVSSRLARLERIVPRADTTVVDAYLSPVIRQYLAALRKSIPDARLHLMTSSGGLIEAAGASGKDTILSGPAGGVVGCAHVTRAAGFSRTIGFDMGGTSTDVCRIEPPPGGFEYQHETVKAGVRIMAPTLAVETVAAGGGSICSFDGQKLTVGPESAGADPGPACYGRGGPLTLTDMNVFLGRIVPDLFPFHLDKQIIARLLEELCIQVNRGRASALCSTDLAEGFVRIANTNMAAAIKQISIAKGYDAREYVLGCFGGAGGQHACGIARILGMRRIVSSPHAGVLSALGIGVAPVKRIGQRSVDRRLDEHAPADLQPVIEELTDKLRSTLLAEGNREQDLAEPVCTWDSCYAGQATLITVPAGDANQARIEFENRHRQLYGYTHEGRRIEIRIVRVELVAHSDQGSGRWIPPISTRPSARRVSEMVLGGQRRTVDVHLRGELSVGRRISGPAIIVEDTSTIVVDPGWNAEVGDRGDIILTDTRTTPVREHVELAADPIQLELFSNQFTAVAEQMGATLRRTALSTNVKERLDFSCAVFTPAGDLVVNAPHIPVHLGGMSDCIKSLIEDVRRFDPGDVYVTNDPYRGGSHLNDVTVITPVYDDDGAEILFLVASRAHHAEIGGRRPGSMPPDSKCLADEGVVIRVFRWIRAGRPQTEALRALLSASPYPSRMVEENLADIAAQVAANHRGAQDLRALVARYGVAVVHAYMRHIQNAAERKMRAALNRLPDGVSRFEDHLDDGTPIVLSLTVEGDQAVLDFTGTGPVSPGNLNANPAIVTSAILYCLRCLLAEDIPLNQGVLAPIEIVLPEGLLNPPSAADPRKCPAMAAGNVETSQRVVDVVFGALGVVAASQGTMNNILIGNDRFGYYETICGGAGAGPTYPGADAVHTHMTNTRLTDPEVLESRYPLRLRRFAVRPDSGGTGRFRGGNGVIRELEFLEPLELSIISQRRTRAPYGLCGGESGRAGRNHLIRSGASVGADLPSVVHVNVDRGDRLIVETPGGGGYGKELESAGTD